MPPVNFEEIKAKLAELEAPITEEAVSSYCLYPKVFTDQHLALFDFYFDFFAYFHAEEEGWCIKYRNVKATNISRKKADKANQGEIGATLSGSVVKVLVEKGQAVTKGTPLVVTEAKKMETTIAAPISGIVAQINVTAGNRIESGDCLLEIELKA